MGDATKIEWTDASWTPLRAIRVDGFEDGTEVGWHCEKVSAGCQMCYAETLNMRLGTRQKYGSQSRDKVRSYLDDRMLTQPLRWNRPRRIFVCSMTDLFGEWVPDEHIDRVFAVMALAPQHTFQVLTKRPERMREYVSHVTTTGRVWGQWMQLGRAKQITDAAPREMLSGALPWPLPNVWLGTSVEDQAAADKRIPELLATPAAVRFLSCEPLIGPVDVRQWLGLGAGISWVIAGGESGPGARPMDLAWARALIEQCRVGGIAPFVKQLGSKPRTTWSDGTLCDRLYLRNRKGGEWAEWPLDLRVREYPTQEAR